MFSIVIVGRPNVGKSTLFNKIIGRRAAIVDGTPGVTRDRHAAIGTFDRRSFVIIDSGGFEPDSRDPLLAGMREQTLMAIEEADTIFFVVDGMGGLTTADEEIGRLLRRGGKPVTLLVNKIDHASRQNDLYIFARLGFEHIYAVSAEHSMGINEVMEETVAELPQEPDPEDQDEELPEDMVVETGPIRIAVVGKPNVGKSSLVNRFLGADRMMVSNVAGTTRDAIDTRLTREGGGEYTLIDTAGIRKKARISEKLEKYSVIMAMKAISRADLALLVIDVEEGVAVQEAKIGHLIQEAGVSCVIAVNKWDAQDHDPDDALNFTESIYDTLPFLGFAPVSLISAKTGRGVEKLFAHINRVHAQGGIRIPTARLNEIVAEITRRNSPPIVKNKRLKFYYVTQTGIHPPSFVFMCNYPEEIPAHYRRYMVNQLRERAGFTESPLKVTFRKPSDRRIGGGPKRNIRSTRRSKA